MVGWSEVGCGRVKRGGAEWSEVRSQNKILNIKSLKMYISGEKYIHWRLTV